MTILSALCVALMSIDAILWAIYIGFWPAVLWALAAALIAWRESTRASNPA